MSRAFAVLVLTSAMLFTKAAHGADFFNGERIYQRLCVGCHGEDGRGGAPGTPDFRRGGRLLRGDRLLLQTVRDGRAAMPGYFGVLDDYEILDVIAYLRTLR